LPLPAGFKLGPFFYLVQCVGTGKVQKHLLKAYKQEKHAGKGIAAQLKCQHKLAKLSEINIELLRIKTNGSEKMIRIYN
jgi:hypothetical protein